MFICSKIMQYVGAVVAVVGACMFDSDPLWLPLAIIGAGLVLVAVGTLIRSGYVEY